MNLMGCTVSREEEKRSKTGIQSSFSMECILILFKIFYLAEIGKKPEDLAQSVFIEQLDARGYEVLLLTEPLDEILIGNLRAWK